MASSTPKLVTRTTTDLPLGTTTLVPPVVTVTSCPAPFLTKYSLKLVEVPAGSETVAVCPEVREPVIARNWFRASEDAPSAIKGTVVVAPAVTAMLTAPVRDCSTMSVKPLLTAVPQPASPRPGLLNLRIAVYDEDMMYLRQSATAPWWP
jgi:hypothetical protein